MIEWNEFFALGRKRKNSNLKMYVCQSGKWAFHALHIAIWLVKGFDYLNQIAARRIWRNRSVHFPATLFQKEYIVLFFALECSMRKYIKIQLPKMECKAQSQLLLYNRVQSGQTHFKPILLIKWSSGERNQSKLISDSEKYIYTFFVRSMQKNEHHVNSNFCRTLSYQRCDASH